MRRDITPWALACLGWSATLPPPPTHAPAFCPLGVRCSHIVVRTLPPPNPPPRTYLRARLRSHLPPSSLSHPMLRAVTLEVEVAREVEGPPLRAAPGKTNEVHYFPPAMHLQRGWREEKGLQRLSGSTVFWPSSRASGGASGGWLRLRTFGACPTRACTSRPSVASLLWRRVWVGGVRWVIWGPRWRVLREQVL